MKLLAFPCDMYIAGYFIDRLDVSGAAALILKKQRNYLRDMLLKAGIGIIYELDEDLYGKITKPETRAVLREIEALRVEGCWFPINGFCGNVALLLFLFSSNVTAVSATSAEPVSLFYDRSKGTPTSQIPAEEAFAMVQDEIIERLGKTEALLESLFSDDKQGERPTAGLIRQWPNDYEVLSRYMYAGTRSMGKALEIGCGIGYGAFAITRVNPDVMLSAIDHDSKAVEFARTAWGEDDKLKFNVLKAESLPFDDGSLDCIICYDVIEHLHDPAGLLKEANRTLREGGLLIGSTPNYRYFPYRVNTLRADMGGDGALREMGIWPWHIQELDEGSIRILLNETGFTFKGFKYPTFAGGISLLRAMNSMRFEEKVEYLSSKMSFSVTEFVVLDVYTPLFSGYSFIFEAYKGSMQ